MGKTRPKKILLVDDEEIIRDALGGLLKTEGYKIIEACDGVQAIERLHGEQFDLVITDIKMPKKSGMDVLIEAKQLYPDIEVIMITGFTSESPDKALELGAKDFIYKSSRIAEFIDMILNAIER